MTAYTGARRRRSVTRVLRDVLTKGAVYLAILPLAAFIIMPFAWMLGSSFKPIGSGIKFPPQFIPNPVVFTNYPYVFKTITFFKYLLNSLTIVAGVLVGEVLSASVVGFAFARLRFPGRNTLFMLLLATMMIPYPVTMVPTFIVFRLIRWVDT